MMNARILGRMGLLAVGAALAASPGNASADSSTDWWSDLLGGLSASAPAPSSELNLAISIDGIQLLQDGTATANSGTGDIAIAYGDGAVANAVGGIGDTAIAGGTDASAQAGGLSSDTGANAGNFDTAIDIGSNSSNDIQVTDGAFAGNFDLYDLPYRALGTGSYDTAIDIGNNTGPFSDGAYATAGLTRAGFIDSDHNTAIDIGSNSGAADGAGAGIGDGNYASQFGDITGSFDGPSASVGNNNIAISDATGDVAANAGQGNNNIAYIFDPFGPTTSAANAGGDTSTIVSNNSDLAAVLLTDGNATATGADNIYDIITALGNESGTAAATSGGFLGELLSLF
jgi:trimeric autotransporter adhesin